MSMMLQLTLPPELEDRLRREAQRQGQPTEAVALRMLDQHLPLSSDDRRAAAIAMLRRWSEEDASLTAEEGAANAVVLRELDENLPSYQKLFTDLLTDHPK